MSWPRNLARVTVFLLLGTVGLLGGTSAASAGGGGCHSTAITDERGVSVTIAGFCFEPTVLRIHVGETVTWTNQDAAPHMVSGVNYTWGTLDQFGRGASVTARFDEPGIYPYLCPLHVSMVGTVVVEDGAGANIAGAGDDSTAAGWGAAGAVAGMALMSVGMIAWRRRPSLPSHSG